jgi:phosphinothricin acetyltransferase
VATTLRTHPFLVAERDRAVVGYAYAAAHNDRAAYRWAADVSVYIAASAKRQGIGRALYTKLLQMLRAQGLVVACAGITLPNDASVALHEAFGFEPVGVYRGIGFKLGEWHDVGYWQLELVPRGEGAPTEPVPYQPS